MITPVTYDPDGFTLSYHPEQHLLIGRWLRPAPLAEIQAHYEALLAAALAQDQCRHWLLDVRRRPAIDPDAAQWFREDFGPRLPVLLEQPVALAYFAMVNQTVTIQDATLNENVRQGSLQNGHYRYFNQESEALAWLALQP